MSVAPNPLRIAAVNADAPIPPEPIEATAALLLSVIENQDDKQPAVPEPADG